MEVLLGQERGKLLFVASETDAWSQLWKEIQEEHFISKNNDDVLKHPAGRSSHGPRRRHIEN